MMMMMIIIIQKVKIIKIPILKKYLWRWRVSAWKQLCDAATNLQVSLVVSS